MYRRIELDTVKMETGKQQVEEGEEETQQVVWSWGAGTDGQLATGKLQDELTPQLLLHKPPISFLSCGGAHAIALTLGGRVFTWGRGSSGQLGHGDSESSINSSSVPTQVKPLQDFVITHASAGWNHSAFIAENGALFTCGDGSFGQLGHGDYKSQPSPKQVLHFSSNHVEQVACGMRHTLVLLREGQVYGFGSGKRGQLGISVEKVKSTNLPQITLGLTNVKVVMISANGDHSAALSAEGSLYAWGRGFGSGSDECIPRLYESPLPFSQVALGWNHALLLTREGNLFMLGGDRHGVLSDPQKISSITDESGKPKDGIIQPIPYLAESKVVQIAAGSEHSALLTDDGRVMTWGWGEHGQLGLGDTSDQTAPQVVSFGHKLVETDAVSRVYCGSGFSFFLTNGSRLQVSPKP